MKKYGFYKGVNLGGWFSQCDYTPAHLDSFITEPDFAALAEWGIDHVRIPVDYNLFQAADGSLLEDGFRRLEHAFALARKYHLNVILDLHKTAGFSFDFGENEAGFFDNAALQEQFYALWEAFAKRFGNAPDRIAFELLNEVTDKQFMPAWNRIIAACVSRIRAFAKNTLILIGGYDNNAAWAVPEIAPLQDSRIVYNFHCYEPLKFTHQGATWTPVIDPAARQAFADSETSADYFEKLFLSAVRKAQADGVPLYCGEYGVIDRVSAADTLAWFRCIHGMFEQYGIGRAAWTYRGLDFGLTDERLDAVRAELLSHL